LEWHGLEGENLMEIVYEVIRFLATGAALGIMLILYTKKLYNQMEPNITQLINNVEKLVNEIGDDVKQALTINDSVNQRIEIVENKLKQLEL
jgi:hypothetical protein